MSDSLHLNTERLRSNATPSVRKTFFSRKNDPLAVDYVIGGELNTGLRKGAHCRIGREPLVDNSSFENAHGGLAWDDNGFGLLGSPHQQAFFQFVETVLQERFSRIYQNWLSKFPAGDKEAMLYEVLKHAAFTKEIGKVTAQQLRDLYGETGARPEIYVERPIRLLLQVYGCPCISDSENTLRIAVQVGASLIYKKAETFRYLTVDISCGVYLDGPLVVEDDAGHEAYDISSSISSRDLDAASVASMLLSGFSDYGETECLEGSLTEVISSVSQLPENLSLQVGSSNVTETTNTGPV